MTTLKKARVFTYDLIDLLKNETLHSSSMWEYARRAVSGGGVFSYMKHGQSYQSVGGLVARKTL